jgi:acyl carrier protein
MTEAEIRSLVENAALEVFELEPDEIDGDPSFADLDVDSLRKLEFIASIEQQLGIRVSATDGSRMDSLSDMVRVVQHQL